MGTWALSDASVGLTDEQDIAVGVAEAELAGGHVERVADVKVDNLRGGGRELSAIRAGVVQPAARRQARGPWTSGACRDRRMAAALGAGRLISTGSGGGFSKGVKGFEGTGDAGGGGFIAF